jgi:hypothetical protein
MACKDVEKAKKVRGKYPGTSQKNAILNVLIS